LPLATTFDNTPLFTTDISFVAFLLPFGLPGLVIFFGFVFAIWKTFISHGRIYSNNQSSGVFVLMLVTSLLVSLNIDIFSRKIFVIYIAVFAVLHFPSQN